MGHATDTDTIIGIIDTLNCYWKAAIYRFVAEVATGTNTRVPSDEEVRTWLDENPSLRDFVGLLVHRIPPSWKKR